MVLRIILVDDHTDFRSTFRQLLERKENYQVIAEAENGDQAIQLVEELNHGSHLYRYHDARNGWD